MGKALWDPCLPVVRQAGVDESLVEAGGIEPPSEGFPPEVTTCLVAVRVSFRRPPATGS